LETAVLRAVFSEHGVDSLNATSIEPILLFCNTTTLKTVNICFIGLSQNYRYSQEERNAIVAAFRSTNTLESLRIFTHDAGVVESILTGIADGNGNGGGILQELKLWCYGTKTLAYWTALSNFTHASTQLKHLQLENETLQGDADMGAFLRCLISPSHLTTNIP
jgi:hypothetical protein